MRQSSKPAPKMLLVLSILLSAHFSFAGFVKGVTGSGSGSSRTLSLSSVSPGNRIIVCAGWGSSTATATVSDSQGNSYQAVALVSHPSAAIRVECWTAVAVGGGLVSATVLFSASVGNNVHVEEYSGLGSITAVISNSGTGTSVTAPLSAGTGELLVMYANNITSATWSSGTLTIRTTNARGSLADGIGSASMTMSTSSSWNALAFTFQAVSAPPPPPPPPPGVDSIAPTRPRVANARAINAHTVEVFCAFSVDNVGVQYNVYRAIPLTWGSSQPLTWTTPTLVATVPDCPFGKRAFLDTDLLPSSSYVYFVSGIDPSGNESSLSTWEHSVANTPAEGNFIETQVYYTPLVRLGNPVAVVQKVVCWPACTIAHHDIHSTRRLIDEPNLMEGDGDLWSHGIPDATISTIRISTHTANVPTSLGSYFFLEDGHAFGPGFPLTAMGRGPHKEGPIWHTVVTNGDPPRVVQSGLPAATVGVAYSQALTLAGEIGGTWTWGVSSGRLPPGLSLSTTGIISGTASQNGTYSFTVLAESSVGTVVTRDLLLIVQ